MLNGKHPASRKKDDDFWTSITSSESRRTALLKGQSLPYVLRNQHVSNKALKNRETSHQSGLWEEKDDQTSEGETESTVSSTITQRRSVSLLENKFNRMRSLRYCFVHVSFF